MSRKQTVSYRMETGKVLKTVHLTGVEVLTGIGIARTMTTTNSYNLFGGDGANRVTYAYAEYPELARTILLYIWFAENHNGMSSREYRIVCMLGRRICRHMKTHFNGDFNRFIDKFFKPVSV